MLLGATLSGVLCLLVVLALRRALGPVSALAVGGLLWSLAVIACLTLLPAQESTG